ncbi:MAG: CalU12 protein [Rhizobium sp.]|nr:CalU12 protein [Rhizobium sp.]
MDTRTLAPAMDLAIRNGVTFPHESDEYRSARIALLAEEIELRRHIERVAEMRRALPPGGSVKKNYQFIGENGPVSFEDLFGDKDTLVVYTYMFGPQRERPCPMCTSLLSSWDGETPDIMQRVGFAVVARSPIERLAAFKKERGWHHLPLYSDVNGEFSHDHHAISPDGGDDAGLHVFTRRDGTIRHFWSGEMGGVTADPGQDPRGAPDLMPLWTIIDCTPEGRSPTWYPKLSY